ncbi:MAG: nitrilase/cyanide hydratase and apolipoprotein N-acyltransferase [Bacteroidetes bacterium OLB10]|nr:MAG: nitrilase/cyanide hydratase and apolipoprotein N-acyltransferase [Bacteroidetes bacterium OLB10]
MSTLRVTTVQAKLQWENAGKNLKHFSALLKSVKPNSTDVIVLPEMFSTGFSMNAKKACRKNGWPFHAMDA